MTKKRQSIEGLVVKFDPRNSSQKLAKKVFSSSKVLFLLGDAGVGKTFTALGLALEEAVLHNPFQPITVCRPAIEATTERLGFLPGDINQKIDPYLKPIFDCLSSLAFIQGPTTIADLFSPVSFAHMRGLTFNSVVILDEAQNCTNEQLLMFLTRLGSNGRMLIT